MARRGRVRYDPLNDFYLILGVRSNATADEIQAAFRQRAKKLHPDRNPDGQATAQFQRLSEAYAVLGDPALRAEYDTRREARGAWQSDNVPPAPTSTMSFERIQWRTLIRGLWNGPYRYVLVVLVLVVLLNVALVVATNQNQPANASLALPPTANSPDVSPTPAPVNLSALLSGQCTAIDRILSPPSNALLPSSGFEVVGVADGAYQLDWAWESQIPTSDAALSWVRLTSADAMPPHGILADASRIAPFIAALPGSSEVILRLTVFPNTGQSVQACEIAVLIQK